MGFADVPLGVLEEAPFPDPASRLEAFKIIRQCVVCWHGGFRKEKTSLGTGVAHHRGEDGEIRFGQGFLRSRSRLVRAGAPDTTRGATPEWPGAGPGGIILIG